RMLPTRTPDEQGMEAKPAGYAPPAQTEPPEAVLEENLLDNESLEEGEVLVPPPIDPMGTTGPLPALGQTTGGYVAITRNMAKSSGIYALASLGPPLVSLVLAPFLTHQLSPSDYGILTVLTTVISLAAGITQLGLNSAFFRVYGYEYSEPEDRRAVLASIIAL